MYQVLYRKWRPKVFSDVVGQPQVTITLKNELKSGRVAHAYLFTGSRGTGKTTCAKILAKAINCLNLNNGDPCGECEICKSIDNGSIMDIVEIDAASNNGVENIRNLREEASFTPALAKYRVYIIDEVHMLSVGAFNALLKTLEEPPKHVVFILATTEIHKIPATILSRCQRFDFNRIPPENISERLKFVAESENVSITDDAALLIAKISDGALRDALSLLDQCMGRGKNITSDIVGQVAGLADREYLHNLFNAVREKDSKSALELIDSLYSSSMDMIRLCDELIDYYRDIMLIKTMGSAKDIIVVSQDEYEKLQTQADSVSLEEIIHVMDVLQETSDKIHRGINRKIEMEMSFIKLCNLALDTGMSAINRRISDIEKAIRGSRVVYNQPLTKPESTKNETEINDDSTTKVLEKEVSTKPKSSSDINMESLAKDAKPMNEWPEVLKILKGYSQLISTAFHGSIAYVSGDFVLIDAPNQMAFELLRKSSQRDKMRVAIKDVTGRSYRLGPYKPSNDNLESTSDPLDQLEKFARESGIDVKHV